MMIPVFLFALVVQGVVGGDLIMKEGEIVKLPTDFTKGEHEDVLWFFNGIRIALINGQTNTSCLYDGEGGIFKDKLDMEHGTGSLTIKEIGSEHAGRYDAEYNKASNSKSEPLNENKQAKCNPRAIIRKGSDREDIIKTFNVKVIASLPEARKGEVKESDMSPPSGLSAGVVVGICVGALTVVAAVLGFLFFCRQKTKKQHDMEKNKQELLQGGKE